MSKLGLYEIIGNGPSSSFGMIISISHWGYQQYYHIMDSNYYNTVMVNGTYIPIEVAL